MGATIRERDEVRRQVKTLSAEGRMSAYVMLALPIVMALIVHLRSPDYLAELTSGAGLVMAAVAAGLMVVGALWLRRLCRLVF